MVHGLGRDEGKARAVLSQRPAHHPFIGLAYWVLTETQLRVIDESLPPRGSTIFSALTPVVLLTVPDGITASEFDLQSAIDALFARGDDVLCRDFLGDTVILQGETADFAALQCGSDGLCANVNGKSWKPRRIIQVVPKSLPLPSGPYFLTSEGVLAQAYRLYPDVQEAFCVTIVPDTSSPYS